MTQIVVTLVATLALALSGLALPALAVEPPPPLDPPSSSGAACEWYGEAHLKWEITEEHQENQESGHGTRMLDWVSAPSISTSCGANWTIFQDRRFLDIDQIGCIVDGRVFTGTGYADFLYDASDTGTGNSLGTGLQESPIGIWNSQVYLSGGQYTEYRTIEGQDACSGAISTGERVPLVTWPAHLPIPGGTCPATAVAGPEVQAFSGECITTSSGSADPTVRQVTVTETITWSFRRTLCDVTVDSDGGGVSDCDEYEAKTNPAVATDDGGDTDGDGIPDGADNCVSVLNADQSNLDADAAGDVCDSDMDGDGVANTQEVTDGTNPANSDTDGDTVLDGSDDCPLVVGNASTRGCPEDCQAYKADVGAEAGTTTSTLFTFDVTAIYRVCEGVTGEKSVEVRNVTYAADAPVGVTTGLLETLGFTTQVAPDSSEQLETELRPGGVVVSAQSQLDMCFDFATLIDRIGLKDKAGKAATQQISKLIAKYGKGKGSDFGIAVETIIRDLKADTDKAVAKAFGKLKTVSADQAAQLHQGVQTKVDEQFQKLLDKIRALLGTSGSVQSLKLWLDGGGISSWLTELTTACFVVWQPVISITVPYSNGIASSTLTGFENPVFARASITKDEFTPLP